MAEKNINVLFVCSDNSARCIFAEQIINRLGQGKFKGFSAGSGPDKEISPLAVNELKRHNYLTDNLGTNELSELKADDSPVLDFVFVLSESIDPQEPSNFQGNPMIIQWHLNDPTRTTGSDLQKQAAFARTFTELNNRISIFVNLPLDSLDDLKLRQTLEDMS